MRHRKSGEWRVVNTFIYIAVYGLAARGSKSPSLSLTLSLPHAVKTPAVTKRNPSSDCHEQPQQ